MLVCLNAKSGVPDFHNLISRSASPVSQQVPAPFEQQFAHAIFKERYAFNPEENWEGLSHRVTAYNMGALYSTPGARQGKVGVSEIEAATERVFNLHSQRQFIAGGRYLYATGRD